MLRTRRAAPWPLFGPRAVVDASETPRFPQLEYGTPVKITTGDLETAYKVNFPRFGRPGFSQRNSVVLGSPSVTAAIHGPSG